jgi:hypothetical protein
MELYSDYATAWTIQGSHSGRGKKFFFLQIAQSGCGAHPDPYKMGLKRPGPDVDHSDPSSAEFKDE